MSGKHVLETMIMEYVNEYVTRNRAAKLVCDHLDDIGLGVFPVLDHITVRTVSIEERAQEFLELGYVYSETLEYDNWWAKVYRAPGCCPALFVDQAYVDDRGESSIIPAWVRRFGDRTLHHIAIQVADIERALAQLRAKGVEFAGTIVGEPGGDLRQSFLCLNRLMGVPSRCWSLRNVIMASKDFLLRRRTVSCNPPSTHNPVFLVDGLAITQGGFSKLLRQASHFWR